MNVKDLRPVSELVKKTGVKCLIFGPPGVGKTPLATTAPKPILCATEPGLLSIKDSKIPTWEAYTAERIDEFFTWLKESGEALQFETIIIDSGSMMAECFLKQALEVNKDGRAAYGEMSRRTMACMSTLYLHTTQHVVVTCKQTDIEFGKGNVRRPYFPGKELNALVPHLFDNIWFLTMANISGQPGPIRAIRTKEDYDIVARTRVGDLGEYAPPDLTKVFKMCLGLANNTTN